MGDGSLSQEEIDALLMGEEDTPSIKPENNPVKTEVDILNKFTIPKEKPMNDTGILNNIPITLSIVLGEAVVPFNQLQSIGEGSIVTLDRLAGEDVEIRANNVPIAFGEILVIDESFGIRVTHRIAPEKQKELMAKQSKTINLNITELK